MNVVPTWEGLLSPILEVLTDGKVRGKREVERDVSAVLALTESALAETVSSGTSRFINRIGWALSFLARAEAIERPKRGAYVITEAGRDLLASHPEGLNEATLKTIPAYVAYEPQQRKANPTRLANSHSPSILDPTEQLEDGVARINQGVSSALLKRLHEQDPAFLEQSVLDVLVAMGYGGAEKRARRTKLTNDGGIDGVIDQDPLGLDRIYVQAKRYAPDNVVGRPEIQGFVGALHGNQASQGVFITTGRFSQGARDYAESVTSRVILIDGERLADLMITYGVGVQTKDTYVVVEVDEDYFE